MNIQGFFSISAGAVLTLSGLLAAQDIDLPKPVISGGMSLNDALSQRKTVRDLSDKPLSMEQVSSLLWAANGFNRPEEGKRTAPTARNKQELELYILLPTGVYSHDAKANKLVQISKENLLEASKAFGSADIIIVYDSTRDNERFAGVDSGFIGQNVYLYCAANGMGACFKGSVAKEVVDKLALPENKKPLYTISVGLLNDNS